MYLKPFKIFTWLFQNKTSFRRELNQHEILEGRFRNLNFSRSTKKTTEYSFELFLSIYRYQMFFLKFETSILSRNRFGKQAITAFQNTSFSKATVAISRQEKMAFSTLSPGCLGTPLPLPQSLYGQAYERTLTSQPKFLGSIGY